ncbi:response regulator [Sphingomonas sp.]|uniref:response regulator n=1 Tax=Sphingomonas sp. TaxID=28214 RepID=UPI001B073110|nr:response regulator [Sphingomonas sp.]MBO9713253.1 response regulator [Sphingomonas sp.]
MFSRVAPRGLRVLLVEDDEGVRRSLQLLLEWSGFEVRAHARAASAIDAAALSPVDLLVADYLLEDCDGIEMLRTLRDAGWQGRAVLMTGHPSELLTEQALVAGFYSVLEKPLARHALVAALTD